MWLIVHHQGGGAGVSSGSGVSVGGIVVSSSCCQGGICVGDKLSLGSSQFATHTAAQDTSNMVTNSTAVTTPSMLTDFTYTEL